MYKKIELLSKELHKDLTIDKLDDFSYTKGLQFASLGLSEITKMSSRLPVLISGGEKQEFVVLMSIVNSDNYFVDWTPGTATYVPALIRAYPFVMVDAKEEGSDKNFRAIGIDTHSTCIGEDKEFKLFEQDNVPSKYAQQKMQLIQNFDKDRANASKLIQALKQFNLLDKRNFDIKTQDGENKTILSDFYVVNKERLHKLEDAVLADFVRRGWMFAIESHIDSISEIEVLLSRILVKKEDI
jgi:hypothetical protein